MWYSNVRQRGSVLPHPTDDLQDHFALGKELGSGFSGVVRLCVDRKTGERVACKTIKKSNLEDEDDFEDVRLEIAVMRRLNHHPNMVGLREVFEDAEFVHLILELCEGGDLFDEIVKRGPLPEMGAAQVVYQMAEALSMCHAKGLMHRDLKPENILLVRPMVRGNGGAGGAGAGKWQQDGWPAGTGPTAGAQQWEDSSCHVKLADFGLAMFLGPFQEASGFAGSPYYVAPEVLSQTWYGREADVWSLGVVLYVLLSGEFPFAGQTDAKLYKAIKRGKLNFSYHPWPTTSVLAKSLIRSMLALDPRARPTAVEIMQHPWIQTTCFPAAGSQYCPTQTAAVLPPSALAYLKTTVGGLMSSPPTSPSLKPAKGAEEPPPPAQLSPLQAEPPLSLHLPQKSPSLDAALAPAATGLTSSANEQPSDDVNGATAANLSFKEGVQASALPVVSQELCPPAQDLPESPVPENPELSSEDRAPTPRPAHKKPNFFLQETALAMTPPKVLSAPKSSSLPEIGSPKSVLHGPPSEDGSDTDSDPGSPMANQCMPAAPQCMPAQEPQSIDFMASKDELPKTAFSGMLSACYTQIALTCTCYSSAILRGCLSRRKPRSSVAPTPQ